MADHNPGVEGAELKPEGADHKPEGADHNLKSKPEKADPFAFVSASMPKGPAVTPSKPPAAKPAAGGFVPPSSQAAKTAAHTSALAASRAFDTEEFQRRHRALATRVSERTQLVARQLHALKRMQLETGALSGPQKHSVEEMRKHLSELSAEVEATRQAFESAKKANVSAEDKVTELVDMKEALVERLTEIVAQNEAAKVSKIEELMGTLETLDMDAGAEAELHAAAKAARAAADAVKRGGTQSSSDAGGREPQTQRERKVTEESAPAFEGF
jgi:hypothetical protein